MSEIFLWLRIWLFLFWYDQPRFVVYVSLSLPNFFEMLAILQINEYVIVQIQVQNFIILVNQRYISSAMSNKCLTLLVLQYFRKMIMVCPSVRIAAFHYWIYVQISTWPKNKNRKYLADRMVGNGVGFEFNPDECPRKSGLSNDSINKI